MQRMKYVDDVDGLFDELTELSIMQRHAIKERYRFLMSEYRYRCRLYSILFYVCRNTMTIGSLAVPALLSIQNQPTASQFMYWITWSISLSVTAANGLMNLFKLDKRFFALHATMERLRSESWQFIQLSGRYSGHHHQHQKPTHTNQYKYYCTQLEKINMKRINDEYIKAAEDPHPPTPPSSDTPGQKPSTDTMVPSPPELVTPSSAQRESRNIVEDDDEDDTKDAIALQMSGSTPASMQQTNSAAVPLLQDTSAV
jgi:hypothetical protein